MTKKELPEGIRLTQRYQSGTLRAGWEETKIELRLEGNVPPQVIDAMRKTFYIGAVYVATHLKYSEIMLEEALEELKV